MKRFKRYTDALVRAVKGLIRYGTITEESGQEAIEKFDEINKSKLPQKMKEDAKKDILEGLERYKLQPSIEKEMRPVPKEYFPPIKKKEKKPLFKRYLA